MHGSTWTRREKQERSVHRKLLYSDATHLPSTEDPARLCQIQPWARVVVVESDEKAGDAEGTDTS